MNRPRIAILAGMVLVVLAGATAAVLVARGASPVPASRHLAKQMLTRTLDAGVPAAWVAGDEVYGADPRLRAELERRGVG